MPGEVVGERVGVHELAALEPVAVAVEVFGAALGDDLDLRAVVAAELRGLPVGRDLEFRDRIHADAIGELLVDADVRDVLAVEREVVLRGAAAIDAHVTGTGVGGNAGNGLQQAGVVAAVDRDIDHLRAGDHARALRCLAFRAARRWLRR